MSKITLDNLSDNLKAYLEGLGLSEEQVLNLINENGLNEEELKAMLKDTMSINELSTNSKTVIGAINELFQSANNGKELIANAIGEPLNAEDTFSAMSNDINSLLSTFKTNMMNNGVTVESSDKFKSLIDKIATLADNNNKLQFVTGTAIGKELYLDYNGIEVELNFKPDIVVVYHTPDKLAGMVYNRFLSETQYVTTSNNGGLWWRLNSSSYVNETGFKLVTSCGIGTTNTYYAIGVGEEDNTLRDSLASILEDEGVSITEEDDMASLITKVDEEFVDKNEIISNLNNQLNELNVELNSKGSSISFFNSSGGAWCNGSTWGTITLDNPLNCIPKLLYITYYSSTNVPYGRYLSTEYTSSSNYLDCKSFIGTTSVYIYLESITSKNIIFKCRTNGGATTPSFNFEFVSLT